MSLQIALDVEGVLTDTHSVTYERSDTLEPEHGEEWGFPTDEHYNEFMHVSQNLWHNHHHLIPPQEDDLRESVQRLHDAGHTIDIVTHRHNVDESIREWLEAYGIEYDGFHTPSKEKHDLDGYDVHIDDKPHLAEAIAEQRDRVMVIVDHPYNGHVDDEHTRVERVSGLSEASRLLSNPHVVRHIEALTEAHGDY